MNRGEMYYDYAAPPARSPGSMRQGYATVGLPSGLGGGRQGQRPLDSQSQHIGNVGYGHDDRLGGGAGYESLQRFDRMSPSMMHSGYMVENTQTWGYNGGAATMNGAMNGNSRLSARTANRRAALPSTWTEQATVGMQPMSQLFDPGMNGNEHDLSGMAADARGMMTTPASADAEQLIPTAIVIKNIQFQCRKEILQGLMVSMNLPQPYAFNYHFDKGVFRGLAFANFSTAEDTAIVIQKMNGLEVMGRKLRVEYKKMLPQDERDRIDREKREKRGQLEEQHRAPLPMHQQSALQALGVSVKQQPSNSPLRDVDLNDPATLEFYTQLTIFKNDPTREVFIFSPDIAPEQRRQIHILAHNMGLEHRSVGEADRRQIQIMKRPENSPPVHTQSQLPNVSWEDHRRGLSRAATFDFAESRIGSSSYHALGRQNPTLELPGSPDNGIPNNLRAAKSFADLRAHSPSPAPSVSSYVGLGNGLGARYGDFSQSSLTTPPNLTPTTSHNAASSTDALLSSNMSSLGLGFDPNGTHMRNRETPGAIGSQRPSANGASRNVPERQPRGPEWGETSSGFTGRGRGHVQRSSDSSDAGRNSGSSRFH
ncbi:putative r3h domain-containing protein [Rosellinia necatrix]|uniref:Putative r3h domain-containing protein n=1 Tax=Rosellinia necatrix TaxID=77044 RepID=A0A1W2TK85_ROSNE|nr:putative r3h domain-containing protein [Rosellinia necatrix]